MCSSFWLLWQGENIWSEFSQKHKHEQDNENNWKNLTKVHMIRYIMQYLDNI